MKLFAIYIGGEHAGANIELHDMRFVLAESIEETYGELRKQWWGTPQSLHLDCWSELTQADGYKITLEREPATHKHRLYYINVGGYDPAHFTEMHQNLFVVAETEGKAKVRALKQVRHWAAFHKDDMFEAEQSFAIGAGFEEKGWYIHLTRIEDESPSPFTCCYKNIGKR